MQLLPLVRPRQRFLYCSQYSNILLTFAEPRVYSTCLAPHYFTSARIILLVRARCFGPVRVNPGPSGTWYVIDIAPFNKTGPSGTWYVIDIAPFNKTGPSGTWYVIDIAPFNKTGPSGTWYVIDIAPFNPHSTEAFFVLQ